MSKRVLEGEVRIYADWEDGPCVLIGGKSIATIFDSDRDWVEDKWDDKNNTRIPGKWRITIERLDE